MKQDVKFTAIEGVRGLLNIWVVACHAAVVMVFFAYVYHENDQGLKLRRLQQSCWAVICMGMGYQVDGFFTISGFLLMWGFQQKKINSSIGMFLYNSIIKRCIRMWPTMIAVGIISFIFNDFYGRDIAIISKTLTFPISDNLPSAFLMGWSNRVDLEANFSICIILYLLSRNSKLSYPNVILMTILSILPRLYTFLVTQSFSYLRASKSSDPRDLTIPGFLLQDRQHYFRDILYKSSNHTFIPSNIGPNNAEIMTNEYLVTYQRLTPFFIGMAFAMYLAQEISLTTHKNSFLHGVLLGLSTLFVSIPVLIGLTQDMTNAGNQPSSDEESIVPDLIISVFGRSIFSFGFAYLVLYRCLLPLHHPNHLSYLSRLLQFPVFQYLGRYSFPIYMVHNLVMNEVTWRYFPPWTLDTIFGSSNIFLQFLFCWTVIYSISFIIAYPIVEYFDKFLSELLIKNLLL